MAEYKISSGSGFTGNAQYYSGSKYEGISLNGISSGSKYHVIMQYRSSVPLSIYSGDYGDYHISTNNIAIPENTGSAKFWSGEFLSIAEENYIGLTNTGWFEVDQVRVKHIPNLVISNNTFSGGGSPWSFTGNITYSNNKAIFTGGTTTNLMYGITIPIKRYRLTLQVSNYVSGTLTCMIGNNPYSTFGVISSNGVHSFDLTPSVASIGLILLQGNSTFIGEVDNVHLYEIPEWVATGNHYCDVTLLDKSSVSQSLMLIATGSGRGSELSTNSGATGLTDWTVPTSGLAQGWSKTGACTTTIVTGNGFSGNAQRAEWSTGTYFGINLTSGVLTNGVTYEIRGKYRCNKGLGIYNWSGIPYISLPVNTGDAKEFFLRFSHNNADSRFYFGWIVSAISGDYIEIDEISIKEVFGEINLPTANLESVVSGKKYTLEGFARLDANSLTYSATNKVVDGDFSASTYWTRSNPTDFDVTGGVAVKSGLPSGVIYQGTSMGVTYTANKVYKVILTLSGLTGNMSLDINGGNTVSILNEGTHAVYCLAGTNGALGLRLSGSTNTLFTIDNVSAFEADLTPTILAQIGTKSVTSTALSIVPNTFTKFVLNFEATASEQSQDLKLYLSGAGSVFVDKLSLTQAYDAIVNFKAKDVLETSFGGLLGVGGNAPNNVGFGVNIHNGILRPAVTDNTNITVENTDGGDIGNNFNSLTAVYNRIDKLSKYINGTSLGNGQSITAIGKVIKNSATYIGSLIGSSYKFGGQISIAQIIRFDNISQSTFNSSSVGLQFPTGGGTEEVLRLTFQDSSSLSNALKDYSPKNHTLTPYGSIDLTNRVKVSEFRTTDTSASALISRMTTAPSNERKYLIDTTVRNLKSTGVWNKLDCLWLMASHHSQSATLNWIKDAHNLSLVASPTFTVDRGFQGDGVSSYIDTQYNAVSHSVNYQLNSASVGYYNTNAMATNVKVAIGAWDASNITSFWIAASGSALYSGINLAGSTTPSILTSKGPMGFFAQSRTDSNITKVYIDGIQLGANFTDISNGIPNITTKLLGNNVGGGSVINHSNARLAFAFIGGGLTNTDITNLTSIVENYLRTVGASVT